MIKKTSLLQGLAGFYTTRTTFILLLLVLFASLSLITINYYTLRITSAVRAYIGGESNYSRGQKDALLYLAAYIQTGDESDYSLFQQEIAVPKGDNAARIILTHNGSRDDVKKAFLSGRNNPADLDNMIWLFNTFRNVYFMKKAVRVWQEAEPFINTADSIAQQVHAGQRAQTLTPAEKSAYLKNISAVTLQLSKKEVRFAAVLGNASRNIDRYLFLANIICTILVLGGLIGYALMMISKLDTAARVLKLSNLQLESTTRELDTFVYSASHDLRAPIASLKGLINITIAEEEPATIKSYLGLMTGITDQLDIFIKVLIDFFRNKKTSVDPKEISLQKLIDESVALVQFMPSSQGLSVNKHVAADNVCCDELRMKMILNNLISNAVKYTDLKKQQRYVNIKTRYTSGQGFIIEVADNGIGIKEEDARHVFEMFFMVGKSKKSTGLGLYIVKETVRKLDGNITLISQPGIGSTFTVAIPAARSLG